MDGQKPRNIQLLSWGYSKNWKSWRCERKWRENSKQRERERERWGAFNEIFHFKSSFSSFLPSGLILIPSLVFTKQTNITNKYKETRFMKTAGYTLYYFTLLCSVVQIKKRTPLAWFFFPLTKQIINLNTKNLLQFITQLSEIHDSDWFQQSDIIV